MAKSIRLFVSVLSLLAIMLSGCARVDHGKLSHDLIPLTTNLTEPELGRRQMSLAERFLENTSESELVEIIRRANFLLIGDIAEFTDMNELPMTNIFNMYLANCYRDVGGGIREAIPINEFAPAVCMAYPIIWRTTG